MVRAVGTAVSVVMDRVTPQLRQPLQPRSPPPGVRGREWRAHAPEADGREGGGVALPMLMHPLGGRVPLMAATAQPQPHQLMAAVQFGMQLAEAEAEAARARWR